MLHLDSIENNRTCRTNRNTEAAQESTVDNKIDDERQAGKDEIVK